MSSFSKSFWIMLGASGILAFAIGCSNEQRAEPPKKSDPTATGSQKLDGIYPHSSSFKTTTEHGTAYLKDRAICTSCHGAELKGGKVSKVSCQNCHQYPHDKKWALPENHGKTFAQIMKEQSSIENPLERNLSQCMNCHANKPNEPTSFKNRHPENFVACNSCHADLPHGQNFFNATGDGGTRHFRHVKMNPEKVGSCYSCHLNPSRSVPSLEVCLGCHEKEPERAFPSIGFGKEKE